MTRHAFVRAAAAAAAALTAVCTLGLAGPARASAETSLAIHFDTGRVDLVVGDKFALTSTITNNGSAPSAPVIAHLNVVSLTSDVYVDPEDWSSSRSEYLPAIAPGQSVQWMFQDANPHTATADDNSFTSPKEGLAGGQTFVNASILPSRSRIAAGKRVR